jgi:hypothetical protein
MQANRLMTNYARPIQVASVQTLQRREVPDADEIIIDGDFHEGDLGEAMDHFADPGGRQW